MLFRKFRQVDKKLGSIIPKGTKIQLIIIGSGSFILKGLLSRVTYDIDTYNISDKKVRHVLAEYNISDMGARVMTICENFDRRLEKVNLPLENIDLFVLSNYDMIISKLGSTRPKDILDIIDSGLIFIIDFDRLEEIIKEELASIGDTRRIWSDIEYLKMLRDEGVNR
ncbi:MAG: hypothetical protein CVU89_04525 [Firmicutes bacterium HGW-Firmicutes-14]|nr:MAG: hypothetical protein CVU89_04525 [Firmicutes bacterium HGW-Firmicutes-14]